MQIIVQRFVDSSSIFVEETKNILELLLAKLEILGEAFDFTCQASITTSSIVRNALLTTVELISEVLDNAWNLVHGSVINKTAHCEMEIVGVKKTDGKIGHA